jgi:hypothetical protein
VAALPVVALPVAALPVVALLAVALPVTDPVVQAASAAIAAHAPVSTRMVPPLR